MKKLFSTILLLTAATALVLFAKTATAADNVERYCGNVATYFGQIIVGKYNYNLPPDRQPDFLFEINKDIHPMFFDDIETLIAFVYQADFPKITNGSDLAAVVSSLYDECKSANTKE